MLKFKGRIPQADLRMMLAINSPGLPENDELLFRDFLGSQSRVYTSFGNLGVYSIGGTGPLTLETTRRPYALTKVLLRSCFTRTANLHRYLVALEEVNSTVLGFRVSEVGV